MSTKFMSIILNFQCFVEMAMEQVKKSRREGLTIKTGFAPIISRTCVYVKLRKDKHLKG